MIEGRKIEVLVNDLLDISTMLASYIWNRQQPSPSQLTTTKMTVPIIATAMAIDMNMLVKLVLVNKNFCTNVLLDAPLVSTNLPK